MNDLGLAVYNLLSIVLAVLTYAIVIRALLSWFRPNPNNPIVRLIIRVTDPILRPLQRIIPPIAGLDLTPVAAIILLQVIQSLLPKLLGFN